MNREPNRSRTARSLMLLMVVTLAIRLFANACECRCPSPDYGLTAIAIKHMAEGTDHPTFYYGQSYMGTLEPAVSALLCRVFGCTPFVACLGTGLFAVVLVGLVYLWGRSAAGHGAGLAAAALCIVGPYNYFYYVTSPHGGYPLALTLMVLALWLGAFMAGRERAGTRAPLWSYLLLGLTAGLIWWNNQLAMPALAVAGLMLLSGARMRIFSWHSAAAGLAFFLGSLPWWIWNLRHEWASLSVAGTLGRTHFLAGLASCWSLFLEMSDLDRAAAPIRLTVLCLFGAAIVWAATSLAARTLRGEKREGDLYKLAALAFLVVYIAIAAESRFSIIHAPRYLIPLWPALAILVGSLGADLSRRLPWKSGWLPALGLLFFQFPVLASAARERREFATYWKAADELHQYCQARGIGALYGGYRHSWINFASGERLCLSGIDIERYAPYARFARTNDSWAVLNNDLGFEWFLSATRANFERDTLDGYAICRQVTPPPPLPRLQADEWASAIDDAGSNVAAIADGNLDTAWRPATHESLTTNWIRIDLKGPKLLAGIRLLNRNGADRPAEMRIQGLPAASEAWTELASADVTDFFWSGPRFYWYSFLPRTEVRFPAQELRAIRIGFVPTHSGTVPCGASELELLTADAPPRTPTPSDVDELIGLLAARKVRVLHADRWESEQVFLKGPSGIQCLVDDELLRKGSDLPRSYPPQHPRIVFAPDVALLVLNHDAPHSRSSLTVSGIGMRETTVGPWTLFDFDPDQWKESYRDCLSLYWAGTGCLQSSPHVYAKRKAQLYFDRALALQRSSAAREDVIGALQTAVQASPGAAPAVRLLADILRSSGRQDEAAAVEKRLAKLVTPAIASPIRFPEGYELLGISPASSAVRRGETATITYYWRSKPESPASHRTFFAHFALNGQLFTDDHEPLEDVEPDDVAYQPYPDTFRVTRRIRVPATTPCGEYPLSVGLYDTLSSERSRPRTQLPTHRRAVLLPFRLTVTE